MAKLNFSIALGLAAKNFKQGLSTVQNQLKGFASSVKSIVGAIGAVELGRNIIEAGRNFQQSMSQVQAVTGATKEQLKSMSDEAKRLGASSKYSASEAANALENLTRNGLTAEQATVALSKTLELAASGNLDLANAADIATNTMNAFKMQASEIGQINDVMAYAAGHSATNVEMLGQAMTNVAPIAQANNVSFKETTAMLGSLANVGIKGAEAGTKLRQVILGLSKPTDNQKKAFKALGVSITEQDVKTQGLTASLQKLIDAGIMNAGNSNELISQIFGSETTAAAASLLGNLESAKNMLADIQANAEGTAASMAKIQMDTLDGDIKALQSAWEGLSIAIFETQSGALRTVVQGLTSFITYAKDNLGTVAMHIASVFAGIKFAPMVRNFITALSSIGSSAQTQANVSAAKVQSLENQILNKKVTIERMKLKATKDGLSQESAYYAKIKREERALEELNTRHHKAAVEARLARLKAYQTQNASVFTKIGVMAGRVFKSIGASMKAAFSTVWPMLLITAITEAVMWLGKMVTKGNEVAEVQRDIKKAASETTYANQAQELEILKNRLEEAHSKHIDEKKLMDEVNRALGTTETKYDKLNEKLGERITKLKKAAEIEGAKDVLKKIGAEKAELLVKRQQAIESLKAAKEAQRQNNAPGPRTSGGAVMASQAQASIGLSGEVKGAESRLKSIDDDLASIQKKEDAIAKMIPSENLGNGNGSGDDSGDGNVTNTDTSGKKTPAQKAAERVADAQLNYEQAIEKAEIRLETGVDNQAQFEQKKMSALESLFDAYSDAYAEAPSDKYKAMINETADSLKEQGKVVTEAKKVQEDANEKKRKEKEASEKLAKAEEDMAKELADLDKQTAKGRDTTFDYKSKDNEIFQANLEFDLDKAKKELDILKEAAEKGCSEAIAQIAEKEKTVTSLEDQLKLAQVKKDIQDLQKEMNNLTMESIQQGWQAVEGIVNSINSLVDTLSSPDASGWEKFAAVVNTVMGLMQTYTGIMQLVNSITETSNMLTGAHTAAKKLESTETIKLAAAETELATATPIATTALGAQAKAAATGGTTSATAAVGYSTLASALEVEAAAAIFAAHASLPLVGVPMAAGFVGTMETVLSGVKVAAAAVKLSTGGKVRGNTPVGDFVPALLNSNETVINTTQESRLLRLANGGGITSQTGGKVEFEIHRNTLRGILNNGNMRDSKIS